MIRVQAGAMAYYQFERLRSVSWLVHGIFTRSGGVSAEPFAALNVSHGVGDGPGNVRANRERIAGVLSLDAFSYCRQVHGSRVRVVPRRSAERCDSGPQEADALITDQRGRALVIQVADCQAVIIVDAVRRVVANVHSGWRGSAGNILGKTVAVLKTRFGCDPGDMLAGIGPSLGPCCAEFVHFRREIPERYWGYRDVRDRFDFWSISALQLQEAGLARENIEAPGLCTQCRTDLFYSYRAEGTTGRFAAVVGIDGRRPPLREESQ